MGAAFGHQDARSCSAWRRERRLALSLRLIVADDGYDPANIPAEQLGAMLIDEARVLNAAHSTGALTLPTHPHIRALCMALLADPG